MHLGKIRMLLLSYLSHGTVGIMIALNITDYIRLLLPIKKAHTKEQPVQFYSPGGKRQRFIVPMELYDKKYLPSCTYLLLGSKFQ